MTPRYGQLAYTSFASAANPGGWQVKETVGDLSATEVEMLVAGIHTGLSPVHPLPPYPTPAQLAAFPRRLSYRRFGVETAAYWHVAPAGTDSSGRPGNVFAHALFDRQAAKSKPRPIELWRSPLWLTPYGSKAVVAAALADVDPIPGDAVTARSVVDFLYEPGSRRLPVLCALLDAVAAAMTGGPVTVLAAESVDNAAQWIGAVSFLTSPATARRLNFSTFDRGSDLGYAAGADEHLVAVPRADLADLPTGMVVIDEAGEVPVAATAWSTMARSVMADRGCAAQLLADIDDVSARLAKRTARTELHPALPMAFAVLGRPTFAEAEPAARAAIVAHAPRELRTEPAVVRAVDTELRALVGDTTSTAWRAVADSAGVLADKAAEIYLERAIVDQDWLEQPGPVPLPGRLPTPVPAALTAAIPAALAAARNRGSAQLIRAVDLVISCGLASELGGVVDEEIVPALADETIGPRLALQLAGRVSTATRLVLAGRLLSACDRRGGRLELDRSVLGWLADGVSTPAAEDLAAAQQGDPVWTAAALRGLCALSVRELLPQDRYPALWWLRRQHPPGELPEPDFGYGPWDPAELLMAVGDGPLPVRACVSTLLGAPDSDALLALADRVLEENADPAAVACAAVRAVQPSDWRANGYIGTHYRGYVAYWDTVIAEVGVSAVHRDFAVRFLVLGALAAAAGIPEAAACAPLMADHGLATDVSREMEMLTTSGAVAAAGDIRSYRGR